MRSHRHSAARAATALSTTTAVVDLATSLRVARPAWCTRRPAPPPAPAPDRPHRTAAPDRRSRT
ncbi:hypothetical protein [Actinosynnema sp. NPDC023587]|uniref:hypothetical protein n=1 Tax=Actinosynnema sp. NPDC023587 TaxID=3154695 RepID=UPI0034095D79